MKPLSPASQSIWDAFNDTLEGNDSFNDYGECLAAAFRALAVRIKGSESIRQDVLDIAAELEGGQ